MTDPTPHEATKNTADMVQIPTPPRRTFDWSAHDSIHRSAVQSVSVAQHEPTPSVPAAPVPPEMPRPVTTNQYLGDVVQHLNAGGRAIEPSVGDALKRTAATAPEPRPIPPKTPTSHAIPTVSKTHAAAPSSTADTPPPSLPRPLSAPVTPAPTATAAMTPPRASTPAAGTPPLSLKSAATRPSSPPNKPLPPPASARRPILRTLAAASGLVALPAILVVYGLSLPTDADDIAARPTPTLVAARLDPDTATMFVARAVRQLDTPATISSLLSEPLVRAEPAPAPTPRPVERMEAAVLLPPPTLMQEPLRVVRWPQPATEPLTHLAQAPDEALEEPPKAMRKSAIIIVPAPSNVPRQPTPPVEQKPPTPRQLPTSGTPNAAVPGEPLPAQASPKSNPTPEVASQTASQPVAMPITHRAVQAPSAPDRSSADGSLTDRPLTIAKRKQPNPVGVTVVERPDQRTAIRKTKPQQQQTALNIAKERRSLGRLERTAARDIEAPEFIKVFGVRVPMGGPAWAKDIQIER